MANGVSGKKYIINVMCK